MNVSRRRASESLSFTYQTVGSRISEGSIYLQSFPVSRNYVRLCVSAAHWLCPEPWKYSVSLQPVFGLFWSYVFSRISKQICYILLAVHEIKFYPHFLCKSTSPVQCLCTGFSTHSTLLHLTTLRMRNIFAIQALHRKLWQVVILLLYSRSSLRKECWELYDRIAANNDKNEPTGTMF